MSELVALELVDDPEHPIRALSLRKLHRMGDALAAGSVFPPVGLEEVDGRYRTIDGWHRVQVHRNAGRDVIAAELRTFVDDGERLLAMLGANAEHGDPLSSHEEEKALLYGESLGLSREQIAVALRRTVTSLERRRVTAAVRVGKKTQPLVIKNGLRTLAGSELTPEQVHLHNAYAGGRPVELLRSLAIACELEALGPVTRVGRTYALRTISGLAAWLTDTGFAEELAGVLLAEVARLEEAAAEETATA